MPIVEQALPSALTYRDPTGNTAVGRASRRSTQAAPVTELRTRLCRAVAVEDGHGTLLLAAHLVRAAG